MTYLRRALKYFIQVTLLMTLIIGALMATGLVSTQVEVAFQHGMSAVYPVFGYQKRKVYLKGDPAEARDGIVEAMHRRGYVLESEQEGVLKFHLTAPVNRATRLWEDTITLTPVLGGFEAEGLSRDLVRVVSAIELHFRDHGND